MKVLNDFPHSVLPPFHSWISMPDGTRLSSRIWLPDSAHSQPVPAILEYIPYRHSDFTAVRDSIMHPYIAGHGYACVRVDLRGSGNSDGLLTDEYLPQELQDGVHVIEWLAAQDWCDGRVGIVGKSWGGFNGLQIAALQPPALKAVISVCSTDDRYADDVHYMGGCLLGENLSWASTMFAYNSCPPDPAIAGKGWRDTWYGRLSGSGLWLKTWLQHQTRDAYWKHGSICEDFSAVQCPVFAVSGWADGYSNAVFRLMEHLTVPRLGLIGPWSHRYPHSGIPGPAIGFLQESLRWWDRWLKGQESGIMQEPMLRVWMQDSVPPHPSYETRPGRWVGEETWPPTGRSRYFAFGKKTLVPGNKPADEKENAFHIQSPMGTGLFAGKWCSYSATPDLPHDQREDDGGALIFDSDPLEHPLEILGAPVVTLDVASTKPVALLCVRLGDMAPDNTISRITYGLLNLTHRESHEHPQPLEPGKRYTIRVKLNEIAQSFPRGHSLRIAISTSYWPLAWPAPESARVSVFPQHCRLALPVRKSRDADAAIAAFGPPEGAAPLPVSRLSPPQSNWLVTHDLAANTATMEVIKDDGAWRLEDSGLIVSSKTLEYYSHNKDDYGSARGETYWERSFARDRWKVGTKTRCVLTSDSTTFYLRAELDAYEAETRIYSANWNEEIPRNLV